MYQISEFSKMSNTPVQTLRYYDNLGLLTPNKINSYNGYRYYSKDQLITLNIIKELKMMGFSLRAIIKVMKNYDEKYFIERKKMLQNSIDNNLESIKRIETLIKKMKMQGTNFQKELIDLIKTEERRKQTMKERYIAAKNKLEKCYDLYHNKNTTDFLVLLEELKNDIFNPSEELDPFWANSAGNMFLGIAFEIIKHNKKEEVSLLNIFHFRVDGKDEMDDIIDYLSQLDKDSYSHINLSAIAFAPAETKFTIMSVFKQKLNIYVMFETKID